LLLAQQRLRLGGFDGLALCGFNLVAGRGDFHIFLEGIEGVFVSPFLSGTGQQIDFFQ